MGEIGEPMKLKIGVGERWKITCTYTLTVTTEFTMYPDNPP